MRLVTGGEINGKRFAVWLDEEQTNLSLPSGKLRTVLALELSDDITEAEAEVVMARVNQAVEKVGARFIPDFKA